MAVTSTSKKGVRSTHPDYDAMSPKWQRARDVCGGRDAIIAATERYLPKLRDQKPESYRSYLLRASFYNASWRTVMGLSGMLFRRPLQVEAAPALMPLLDDVDMRGTPLHLFASDLATEVLTVDRVGILVDFPPPRPLPDGAERTLAAAEAEGLRPTLCRYKTEAITNWAHTRVNNRWVLSMLVLMEWTNLPGSSEFERAGETRYRVLDLNPQNGFYRQRVFRINSRDEDEQVGEDVYPLMNNRPMGFIPFVSLTSEGMCIDPEDPTLMDLFDLNLDHYRVSADYERACHLLATPTPWIAGWQPEVDVQGRAKQRLYMGSDAAWTFPNPQARAEFLEFSGGGITELRENLASKESRMAILGARMLEVQKREAEAADTAAIHRAGEGSILAAIGQGISLGLSRALMWFSEWAGAGSEAKAEVNREFGLTQMDPTMLQALIAAWQAGAISYETLFNRLKAGEILDEEAELEVEQALIAEFTMPMSGVVGASGEPPLDAPPQPGDD